MARPKYMDKYKEPNYSRSSSVYKFDINDKVIYIGGLHDNYKGKHGVITKQSSKGHRTDYSVKFEDGVEINCILETALKEFEDTNNNDMEVQNEN